MRNLLPPAFIAVLTPVLAVGPATADAAQDARAHAVITRHDAAVAKALDGDPGLKAAMDADLRRIAAAPDPKTQAAAIEAYHRTYAARYRQVLAAAHVDLGAVARDLKPVYPGMTYVVVDGLYVFGSSDQTQPVPPPLQKAAQTTTPASGDYSFAKILSCGAIAGAGVTYSARTLDSSLWAAQAGACNNIGTMTYNLAVPARATARIDMKADLSGEVFAVGILGAAASRAEAGLLIQGSGVNLTASKSCSVVVLLAWAASKTCGRANATLSASLSQPGAYTVRGRVETGTVATGVAAGTNGHARTRLLTVTIRTATEQ